ncbi:MAG TPA: hypothetical protein VF789_08620 [Thermoanaerobaculia bacterium]
MLDFQRLPRFNFPVTTGRPQSMTQSAVFPTPVTRAEATINGFDIGFTQMDHHLLREQMDLNTAIIGNTVNVTANFALRDSSGTYDDPYNGFVDVVVLVERNDH